MLGVPGAFLMAISSPYARRGALWTAYRAYHGRDGDVLVWQADTRAMNPTIAEQDIRTACEADPAGRAAAEYGATFRTDVETFVSYEAADAVVIPRRLELPYVPGTRTSGSWTSRGAVTMR